MKYIFFLVLFFCVKLGFAQPFMEAPYYNGTYNVDSMQYQEVNAAFLEFWKDKPVKKGNWYKPYLRWSNHHKRHLNADSTFKTALDYQRDRQAYFSNKSRSTNNAEVEWLPLGPFSWENGPSGYNPGLGRINGYTVNPLNANEIWVATAAGGLWHSIDAGSTWNTNTDQLSSLVSTAVAYSADNSVMYYGTGDRDGGRYEVSGVGLYKSVDNGNNWISSGLFGLTGGNNNQVNDILVNPLKASQLYVATKGGLYKSENYGEAFLKLNDLDFKNIEFKPGDTTLIYAVNTNLRVSSNGGQSFSTISSAGSGTRLEMAFTVAAPSNIYIIACNSDGSFKGLFVSENDGLTFVQKSNTPNLMAYEISGIGNGGQGSYDLALAVSPTNPSLVIMGGINVWKSEDKGATWNISSHWFNDGSFPYTHADIHFVSFDKFGRLFTLTDGGIFMSNDEGGVWEDLSAGLQISQFYKIAVEQTPNPRIMTGAQDNGCNIYEDNKWIHLFGADGMECAFDPMDEKVLYTESQNGGIRRSADNGANFEFVGVTNDGSTWITPYSLSTKTKDLIYAGYLNLHRSEDGGISWEELPGISSSFITDIEISKQDDKKIWFCDGSNLKYSVDGINFEASSFPTAIQDASVDALNDSLVWIVQNTKNQFVYKSTNGGLNFTKINKKLPSDPNCIIVQSNSAHNIYLGTNIGVFYTNDSLAEWLYYGNGLPNVPVNEIEINPITNKMYIATYGRGVWTAELPLDKGVNAVSNTIKENSKIIQNQNNITISTNIPSEIILWNISGQILQNQKNTTSAIFNTDMYASGVYFVNISRNNTTFTRKIIKQ